MNDKIESQKNHTPSGTLQEPIRILVVDDDEQLRRLIKIHLRASNMVVTEAKSNVEACILLEKNLFNLVLLDWDLSGGGESYQGDDTGRPVLEFCRERHPQMPVIVMSGITNIDVRADAIHLEADSYLAKPFTLDVLTKYVSNCIVRTQKAASWFQFTNENEILPLHEVKRRYVTSVVSFFGGNQSEAAKVLNISRNTVKSILISEKDGE